MSATAKTYDFPVTVKWAGGRRTVASVPGKDDLEVVTPPEFKHGIPGRWSPEDLLVASVATCFAVTLVAVAERRAVPLLGLEVGASGTVTRRTDGRFGFSEVVLDVVIETESGCEAEAASAAEAADLGCLVAASVDFPVRLVLDVRARALEEVAR
jgi:organic hydroperoxide reductase OsmC/OhrA